VCISLFPTRDLINCRRFLEWPSEFSLVVQEGRRSTVRRNAVKDTQVSTGAPPYQIDVVNVHMAFDPVQYQRSAFTDSPIFPLSAPAVCSSSAGHQKLSLDANIYSRLLFDLAASTRASKNNSLISYHRHLPHTSFLESSPDTITSNSQPLSQMEIEGCSERH
jgi:hypothetical protein